MTAAAETENRTDFKVTPELLTELRESPKKIHEYPGDQRKQIMAAQMKEMAGQVDPPAEKPITPEPPPEPKPEAPAQPPETPEEKPQEEGYFRKTKRTAKEWEDRANAAKQKTEAAERQYQELQEKIRKAKEEKIEAPPDLYSEENQNKSYEELQKLRREVEVLTSHVLETGKGAVETAKTDVLTASERATYQQMEELQDRFGLKTKKPIQLMDKEYGEFIDEIVNKSGLIQEGQKQDLGVVRKQAWDMWTADAEFQKKVTRKPPEEMDKLRVLLLAQNRKETLGGTLKSNLLDILDEEGVLPKMFTRAEGKAAQDAAARTLEAMGKGNEIKTLGPNDGRGGGSGFTPEDARRMVSELLQKKRDNVPWTPQERELFQRSHRLLQVEA